MNCLKCERALSLLSPIAPGLIANGGRMNVEFGYDRPVEVRS